MVGLTGSVEGSSLGRRKVRLRYVVCFSKVSVFSVLDVSSVDENLRRLAFIEYSENECLVTDLESVYRGRLYSRTLQKDTRVLPFLSTYTIRDQ